MEDRGWRINALIACAYLTVLACAVLVVWATGLDDYAKSIITLILGRFLGYIDQAYAFEFGSSRNSKQKDETIATLTANQPPKGNP